jgi:serine/threonine protein kinase
MGCIAFHLIFGFYPFEKSNSDNIEDLKKVILKQNIQFDYARNNTVSNECIYMIKMMLDKDPMTRITVERIESLSFFKRKKESISSSDAKELINKIVSLDVKSRTIDEKGYDSDQTIVK